MLRKADLQCDVFPRMRPAEQEVASSVEARFRRSGYPYLSGLKCQVWDGTAVLSGAVPTFHLKQLAQELAVHTLGVRRVENQVEVPSRDLVGRAPGRARAVRRGLRVAEASTSGQALLLSPVDRL